MIRQTLLPMHKVSKLQFYSSVRLLTVFAAILIFAASGLAQSSGGIKGKVRSTRGGGIAGATVTVRLDGKDVKSSTANSKGEFTIDGLTAGVYNLVFEAKGYSSGVLYKVNVKSGSTGDLGDKLILSPDQGSLVIVKGSVFFKDGTSVIGAKVDIERVNSDGSVKKLGSGTTNISGEFTFRQPEGSAKLRITAKYEGTSGSKEIEVAEPAIYRLAITLDRNRNEK